MPRLKRISASFFPPIALASQNKTPMYRQLYDWFRKAILDGQMRPGQRVPSTRGLASELKISRIPILNAYEQLIAEGYFETFVGAGTCVASSIPQDTMSLPAAKAREGLQETRQGPRRLSRRDPLPAAIQDRRADRPLRQGWRVVGISAASSKNTTARRH